MHVYNFHIFTLSMIIQFFWFFSQTAKLIGLNFQDLLKAVWSIKPKKYKNHGLKGCRKRYIRIGVLQQTKSINVII